MKFRWSVWLGPVLCAALLLSACGSSSSLSQHSVAVPPTAPPLDASTPPEAVVENFYEWYLDYARSEGNPLEDGAYRSSEYLTPGLVERVDGMLNSFAGATYDPFLCTLAPPEYVTVEEVSVAGETANVVVSSSLPDHTMTVELTLRGGTWKIDYILCEGADYVCSEVDSDCNEVEPSGPGPKAVVEDFYAWYFEYAETQGNPLAGRAYCACEHLSARFVDRVDRIRDSGAPYDPFICAQDLPEEITVEEAVITDDTADVAVRTSFSGHSFVVKLELIEGSWKIVDIVCSAE